MMRHGLRGGAFMDTEAEIELVEAALKGDTIKQAVSFVFKERTENSGGIDELAGV